MLIVGDVGWVQYICIDTYSAWSWLLKIAAHDGTLVNNHQSDSCLAWLVLQILFRHQHPERTSYQILARQCGYWKHQPSLLAWLLARWWTNVSNILPYLIEHRDLGIPISSFLLLLVSKWDKKDTLPLCLQPFGSTLIDHGDWFLKQFSSIIGITNHLHGYRCFGAMMQCCFIVAIYIWWNPSHTNVNVPLLNLSSNK